MQVECKVLSQPPISGTVGEVWFDAGHDSTWVEFGIEFAERYEYWVGVFGKGIHGPKCALPFEDNRHAFVLANGQGYVVEVLQQKLIYKTQNFYLQQAIPVVGLNAMVACDFGHVIFVEPHAQRWRSDEIARDGIRLVAASVNGISGLAEQHNGWEDFTLDVENGSRIKD